MSCLGTTLSPEYKTPRRWAPDANQASQLSWYEAAAAAQMHEEQLQRVELFNSGAAMMGFVIGVITETLTGQGILHQVGMVTLLSQS